MMTKLKRGNFLIAEPFLLDNYFSRSVVLLCEHENNLGSVGFVINRLLSEKLEDFYPELENKFSIPIFFGGPMNSDRLHFIHSNNDLIPGGLQIAENIYWGGDFKLVKKLILQNQIDLSSIKFFLGYSSWDKNQLDNELNEKSWIISEPNTDLIFEYDETLIWKKSLQCLGGDFVQMSHYPIHPSLN